jgi:hypothetical protein
MKKEVRKRKVVEIEEKESERNGSFFSSFQQEVRF